MISVMDVGGTHVTAAVVDLEAREILPGHAYRMKLNSDADPDEFVATLVDCASHLPARPESRWAIALPGPIDYEQGIALYQSVGKFDALYGFDLRKALTADLPGASRISFHGDAEAFLFGERWAGAARGHDTAVGITLGTGVGSCFLREGRVVLEGPGIAPQGRIDLLHYAGRPLEETVSRHSIRRAYRQAADEKQNPKSPNPEAQNPDVREIAQRAREGDRAAADVFTRTYRALGEVLAPAIEALDPTILVVGGSISASWDLVAGPLREGLGDAVRPGRIVIERALHPDAAPLLGAAYLAAGL